MVILYLILQCINNQWLVWAIWPSLNLTSRLLFSKLINLCRLHARHIWLLFIIFFNISNEHLVVTFSFLQIILYIGRAFVMLIEHTRSVMGWFMFHGDALFHERIRSKLVFHSCFKVIHWVWISNYIICLF